MKFTDTKLDPEVHTSGSRGKPRSFPKLPLTRFQPVLGVIDQIDLPCVQFDELLPDGTVSDERLVLLKFKIVFTHIVS